MLRIALLMLFRDRAKYVMLVVGLTFCSLLMTQQSSVFCGLMLWTTATVRIIGAKVWVFDAKVEQINDIIPLREIEVTRVRGIPGVEWAVPLYLGIEQARIGDGSFQNIQLVGLDTATLVGRPMEILKGRVEDLRLPDAVIIDQVGVEKFRKKGIRIDVGTTFEINDKRAQIVALCHQNRSFLAQPYVFTTYDRALQYAKPQRKMLSCVLLEPKPGVSAEELAQRISSVPGLKAYARDELFWTTIWWYIRNTGIPVSFGTVVIMGMVVGIAIAGQTFYLFILDNLRYLAALKAMGARMPILTAMVFLQSFSVGFVGFGIGAGLTTLFGIKVLKLETPPFFMPWQVPVSVAGIIMLICCFTAVVGLRKIATLEPAVVFK
jgi:putative ABC transport system permease protein